MICIVFRLNWLLLLSHFFFSVIYKNSFQKFHREVVDKSDEVDVNVLQEVGDLYWKFLQNGIQFIEELLLQLQEHCNFELETILEDPMKMTQCGKQVFITQVFITQVFLA